MKDLDALANTGKHLVLTRPPRRAPETHSISSYVGEGHVGELMVGAAEAWFVGAGADRIEVVAFCRQVLEKWERFFAAHGL
jgi:hypothetical protein